MYFLSQLKEVDECEIFTRPLPLVKLNEFQIRMAESDEFENVDDDADAGDDLETIAAKAIWVRVANSTGYAMRVETTRGKRKDVQGI